MEAILRPVHQYLDESDADREILVHLVERLQAAANWAAMSPALLTIQDTARTAAFAAFDPRAIGTNEYDAMLTFAVANPDAVTREQYQRMTGGFEQFVLSELQAIERESDPDLKLSWYDQIAAMAERLSYELPLSREEILESMEPAEEGDEDSYIGGGRVGDGVMSDRELDDMFDTLVG